MDQKVSLFTDNAIAAEAEMRALFPATPLQRNDYLSEKFDADIWLKREDLSLVRSYKLRGAFNAIRKQPDQELFICASAGNHAQGVAYACRHFGRRGVVFMPVTAPQQKVDKTRIFGEDHVEIRLVGDYFEETMREARKYCRDMGGHFLSPFDDADVIEGQASVGVEILKQLPKPADILITPVGGGGLASGLTRYFLESSPQTMLYYVEPAGATSLKTSLECGGRVMLEQVNTFVDGAAVARIGKRNFEVLQHVRPEQVLVSPEDRICVSILEMLNVEGVVLEPAGALSIDALGELRAVLQCKTVVCVTSGGNFDFERLPDVKERAQRYAGLKKYFILRMPQRPGALRDFLEILGPDDDIARFEYLKKSARNFGSILIGIETKEPEAFAVLFAKLEQGGFVYRDITNDETLTDFVI